MIRVGMAEFFIWPAYNLWPFGTDTDFSKFEYPKERVFEHNGEEIRLHIHLFDICRFLYAGGMQIEEVQAYVRGNLIDNTGEPPEQLLQAFDTLFAELVARGTHIAFWRYPYFIHRAILECAKKHFALVILANADDSIENVAVRTLPSVDLVDVYLYAAPYFEWDLGQSNLEMYRDKGVKDLRWLPLMCSIPGSWRRLDSDTEILEKCEQIKTMDPVFTWVGTRTLTEGSRIRAKVLEELNTIQYWQQLEEAGIRTNLYGLRMRDGVLEHKDLEPLYAVSTMGVGLPYQSLLNNRLYDLSMVGVAQFEYDPRNELSAVGFVPGEHYIPYDGTTEGLIQQVIAWSARREELSQIIFNAYQQMRKVLRPYMTGGEPYVDIVKDYLNRIRTFHDQARSTPPGD